MIIWHGLIIIYNNIDQLIQLGILREVTGGKRYRVYRSDQIFAILESA